MKLRFIALVLFVAGAGLNLLVLLSNGGMPTRLTAIKVSSFGKIWVPLTEQTRFPFLADVIPASWGYVSIGDILAALGAIILICVVVKRRIAEN